MEVIHNPSSAVTSHLRALLGTEFSERLATLVEGRPDGNETCLLRVEIRLCHGRESDQTCETDRSNTVVVL